MRRTILLAILVIPALQGCGTSPPPVARGLGHVGSEPYAAWDQRVRERFPLGSDEKALLTELRRQHFVINGTRASFRSNDFVCAQSWGIRWSAADNRITDVVGEHGSACL